MVNYYKYILDNIKFQKDNEEEKISNKKNKTISLQLPLPAEIHKDDVSSTASTQENQISSPNDVVRGKITLNQFIYPYLISTNTTHLTIIWATSGIVFSFQYGKNFLRVPRSEKCLHIRRIQKCI